MNVLLVLKDKLLTPMEIKHNGRSIRFNEVDEMLSLQFSIDDLNKNSLLVINSKDLVKIEYLKFDDYFIIQGPALPVTTYVIELYYPFIKKFINIEANQGAFL